MKHFKLELICLIIVISLVLCSCTLAVEGGPGVTISGNTTDNSVLISVGNVTGPAGPEGSPGPTGSPGATGATGLIGNVTADTGQVTAPTVLGLIGGTSVSTAGNDTTDQIAISVADPLTVLKWSWSTLGSNLSWSGIVVTGKAGANITIGQVLYFKSDGDWYAAEANASTTTEGILGIATGNITASSTGRILLQGFIEYDTWSLTVAAPEFISASSAGSMVEVKPSTVGQFVRRVGYAYSSHILEFNPDGTLIGL